MPLDPRFTFRDQPSLRSLSLSLSLDGWQEVSFLMTFDRSSTWFPGAHIDQAVLPQSRVSRPMASFCQMNTSGPVFHAVVAHNLRVVSEHASDARVVELMRLGRPPAPEDEQHTLEAVLSGLEGRRAQATSLSRYVLRERIGIGGAGLVYVAWDPKLCRKVAIKLLRVLEGDDRVEEHRTRLLREAQALAQLTHPNIVSVYDVGTYDLKDVDSAVAGIDVPPSGVFVVMELIEGQSLSDWIRVPDRSWQEIRDVFVAAGRGLAAAHSHGLVHRDFKPHNVVVGHDGEARVVDFGLARAASASEMQPSMTQQDIGTLGGDVTLAGTVLGTPNYMAPEQHRAQQTDARTDQYGFCVALYECLYRELPFRGSTVDELYRAKLRGQLPPPAVDVPVPSWMHAVLKRGLSPEPNDRHETMDALLLELRREGRARPLRRVALAGAGIAAAAVLVILAALPVDGGVQPPKDPEIRARVDELRQQLEESKMLGESGKTREGLDKTRVILTEAKQLGYGPLEAESWLQLGRLHGEAFDPAAEEAAMQALATADANKMDEVRAQATILLVNVLGYIQFRSQEAQQWGKLAQAAIDRMGGDPQLQADLFGSLGHVFRMRGEYLYALELGLRQVAVLEQLGQTGNRLVCALTLVGMTSRKLGDYDQARAYLERAVNTVTQPHEADHPHFADVLMELGLK